MANVPLVANPILPPVPDQPKTEDEDTQKVVEALWKWMKDLSLQIKVLLGSPASSNSGITISLVHPGTVEEFAGEVANIPSGYLYCDGRAVSRQQYSALFSAIGTKWGAGDGTTTFNIPDLQGVVIVGVGQGLGLTLRALAARGGEETHILTTAETPAHGHLVTVTDPGHNHNLTDPGHHHAATRDGGGQVSTGSSGFPRTFNADTSDSVTGVSIAGATTGITAATQSVGSGAAHNNMPPWVGLVYMVKF